jgi:hypothetical protein
LHIGKLSTSMAEKPSEDLSFIEWCGRFLRTVLQIQGTSSSISNNGIPVDEISEVIFGELVKEPGFSESTRGLAILLARKELHALGLLAYEGTHERVPRDKRDAARNLTEVHRKIHSISLESVEEHVLRQLNRTSERREIDHAYLANIDEVELLGGLGVEPNTDGHSRVMATLQDLGQLGLATLIPADHKVRATYQGLIWEQRPEQNLYAGREQPEEISVHPIWRGRGFDPDPHLCFVLMPFKDPFNRIYERFIKPTVEELDTSGLQCQRADDIYKIGLIMEDIWEQIWRARILIAELTGQNPNVMYELGMAHTVGRDVILITQNLDDVPFDLRHHRVIVYENTPDGADLLVESLRKTITSVLGERI